MSAPQPKRRTPAEAAAELVRSRHRARTAAQRRDDVYEQISAYDRQVAARLNWAARCLEDEELGHFAEQFSPDADMFESRLD